MAKKPHWWNGIPEAWEMLFDPPLPAALERKLKSPEAAPPEWILAAFPLLGVAVGLIPALIGRFALAAFPAAAGALIFTLTALICMEGREHGRSLAEATSLAESLGGGTSFADALRQLSCRWNPASSAPAAAVPMLLLVLKGTMLFLLARGGACSWPVVMLTGSFAVQGALIGLPEVTTGKPMLATASAQRRWFYIVTAAVFVIWMAFFPAAAMVVAGVSVWGMIAGFSRYFEQTLGGITAETVTLAGSAAELWLLIVGMLFAVTA